METYQAIIFDLGKVVFDLSFDRVFQAWARTSGQPYEDIKSAFQFDALFDTFEKAGITPAEFRAELSARLGLTLTDQAFDASWCALYLDAYPGIDHLLATLRQRYTLVALTNTNAIHAEVWPVKYASTLRYFQRVFSSHELGARKPEVAAYQLVLDKLQLIPQQVVFLDDNPDNVRTANQLGLEAILVTSFGQMTTELYTLGLLPLLQQER